MKTFTPPFSAGFHPFSSLFTLFLALACCGWLAPTVWGVSTIQTMRVGLYYGETSLTSANLANETGSGFRLGYYGSGSTFTQLGETNEEAITMVRASNVYRSGSTFTNTGFSNVLGCYHIVHSKGYSYFEDAQAVASTLSSGFVAWINGDFQVRMGHYNNAEAAHSVAGSYTVAGTSGYAINVVKMGTNELLFQFDGGSEKSLGVIPDITGESDPITWFKNIQYRGAFRYQRVDQEELTVVNIVDLESYVKGVVPFEMSPNWPLEALKAQAVSARTYGVRQALLVNHKSENFDLCNSAHCQVYYGCGGPNTNTPSTTSDSAVEETAGMYLWYNSALAGTFYSSSHGGGSEAVENVWLGSDPTIYPYLSGVVDPYEYKTDSINSKSEWTVTYTQKELETMLADKGYGLGTSIHQLEAVYSPTGNVIELIVHWENGRTNTLYPDHMRYTSWLALPSIRFAINDTLPENHINPEDVGGDSSTGDGTDENGDTDTEENEDSENTQGGYRVNETLLIPELDNLYVLTENGLEEITTTPYVITEAGTIAVATPIPDASSLETVEEAVVSASTVQVNTTSVETTSNLENYNLLQGSHFATGETYHFNGSGWGHSIGMSQFGAYAMAKDFGFTYDEILEFYFPGTDVGVA